MFSHSSPYGNRAAGPDSLSGVTTAKVAFDFRVGQPSSAAAHLNLVHNTFKELKAAGKGPDAVVVFIGPSVKLISTTGDGFTADKKTLDAIPRTSLDSAIAKIVSQNGHAPFFLLRIKKPSYS